METDTNEKRLLHNAIKNFILRIDLTRDSVFDINLIADKISHLFDRIEKRSVSNFTITVTGETHDLDKKESFNYVLTSDQKELSITFSEQEKAFWIESSQYKSNEAYKETISKIVSAASMINSERGVDFIVGRIGLRYINQFDCKNQESIGKVYCKRLSSIIRAMLKEDSIVRAIGVEEYNASGNRLKIQYGVPNKFYPSKISSYDLLLDIDSYIISSIDLFEVENVIRELNHAAYKVFENSLNPKYLQKLK